MRRTKEKRTKRDNLSDNEKEQLKKYKKKGKKTMCDNLDNEKGTFKKRGQQKKKRKAG